MSQHSDQQNGPGPGSPPVVTGTSPARRPPPREPGMRGVDGSAALLEHAQDIVTVVVGVILVVLAVVLLVAGIWDFFHAPGAVVIRAQLLIDRVLLVLILVEIVHTVVLSLREHRLAAQPFIVVGLVAVIRRILFVLTPGTAIKVSTSELALLIAMVAVFIAGLIVVSRFEKREE
ncbi:MAG: phosphate-starvation-inducible PsiE family protein [Streptosporangiaceae bacterium]|jgi:uncharacterized membrane protein (DUF373 family)